MIASGSTSRPYSRSSRCQFGARRGDARGEQRAALGAEHDVLEHGEILDQHEVLVHHADAERDRVVGVWMIAGLPLTRISPPSAW